MEAAREVSELPIVEMSCPLHISEKLRLRKTANGDGFVLGTVMAAAIDALSFEAVYRGFTVWKYLEESVKANQLDRFL